MRRPLSETLFFKGAHETCKQGRACYVNQKHRGKLCPGFFTLNNQHMEMSAIYNVSFTRK